MVSGAHNAALLEQCPRAIQKQAVGWTRPVACGWLTPALESKVQMIKMKSAERISNGHLRKDMVTKVTGGHYRELGLMPGPAPSPHLFP